MNSVKRAREMGPVPARKRVIIAFLQFTWVLVSLVLILSVGYLPNSVAPQAGQVSNRTVKADRTVEIVNEQATEAGRNQAASQVEQVYRFSPDASQMSEQRLVETFQILGKIAAVKRSRVPDNQSEVSELVSKIPFAVTEPTVTVLTGVNSDTLLLLETNARHVLWRVMEEGVRADRLVEARRSIAEAASDMFRTLPQDQLQAVIEVASEALVPNKNPDFEATTAAQQAAMAAVKPVTTLIPEGVVVVREGEIITPDQIKTLEALGVYKRALNYQRLGGYVLLVACLMSLTLVYLKRERPDLYSSQKDLFLLGIVVVSTAAVSRFLSELSPYLAPVATASILIAILLESRLALVITACMAIFVGVLTQSLPPACVGLITGAAGILALSRVDHRSNLISATIVVGLTSTVSVLVFSLIFSPNLQNALTDLAFGGFNGLISAAIAVGVLPTLEYFFGITTHFRLLDISNPCEPLLQRLLKEAPGTYQHSIMVANLAESAAQAIGANALLCKVGAYYHDIGKMKRPRFFVENQMGAENPHDRLAPSLSTLIILSHVKDGIELARQHRVPDVIIDFIAEHHGMSLVSYFYHQAVSRTSEPVYEEDFRYPGPKPQTRETAIVMLCDGLEAAARTLASPTPEKITELVNKMVKHILEDGQLDECDLSLKDLHLIRESLIRSLQNIYHTRIEYPEPASLHGRKKVTNLRKKA